MPRENFDEQLANLRKSFIEMGAAVENALEDTGYALFNNDKEVARRIVENDFMINEMEDRVQLECITLIATQQPLASDLRLVTSILMMITDLERIADQASDICDITLLLGGTVDYSKKLKDMYDICLSMVKDALNSYVNKDYDLAVEVAKRDDTVDEMFDKIVLNYETIMLNHPEEIDIIVKNMFVAKYLERIADHATNIAEGNIYYLTGKQNRLN